MIVNVIQNHCHAHHLVSLCDQMCHDKSVLPDHDTCAPFESLNHTYQEYDDSNDEVNFQGELTSLDGTLIGQEIPQNVHSPQEWRTLVDDMRAAPW